MTHKRFKKIWNLLRLYLVLRELKRRKPPVSAAPLFTVLALLALVGCGPVATQFSREPIVVILRDGRPACSGFAISPTQVLTAAHCVRGKDVDFVTSEQWDETASAVASGKVEYVDRERDLAVVSSELPFRSFVELREPREGETVEARSVFHGASSSGEILPGGVYYRDTDVSIVLGWSGSPVFGRDGRVVGLVHSCETASDGAREQCIPHSMQLAVLP